MKELPKVEDKDFQYTVSADIPWMKDLLKLDERLKTKYELSLEPVVAPEDPYVKQMDDLSLEIATALQLYESRGVAFPNIEYSPSYCSEWFRPTTTKFGYLIIINSETPMHVRRDGAWCILKKRYAKKLEEFNGWDTRVEQTVLSMLFALCALGVTLLAAGIAAKIHGGYNDVQISLWMLLFPYLMYFVMIFNSQFFTISIPKFLSRNIWRFGRHETKTATYEYARCVKNIRNQIFNA